MSLDTVKRGISHSMVLPSAFCHSGNADTDSVWCDPVVIYLYQQNYDDGATNADNSSATRPTAPGVDQGVITEWPEYKDCLDFQSADMKTETHVDCLHRNVQVFSLADRWHILPLMEQALAKFRFRLVCIKSLGNVPIEALTDLIRTVYDTMPPNDHRLGYYLSEFCAPRAQEMLESETFMNETEGFGAFAFDVLKESLKLNAKIAAEKEQDRKEAEQEHKDIVSDLEDKLKSAETMTEVWKAACAADRSNMGEDTRRLDRLINLASNGGCMRCGEKFNFFLSRRSPFSGEVDVECKRCNTIHA